MQIGEIVVLKSGSVQMTVESMGKDGCLVCVWCDRRQKICRGAFPADVLRPMPR